MSFRTGQSNSSGFTLVELLLAISLMSILLALAYGGLRASTRASERGQVALEEAGNLRTTHLFVRRQINQTMPLAYGVLDDARQSPVMFEGEADRIRFVAPMPGYLGKGGPQVQTLQISSGGEQLDLEFTHQLLLGYSPDFVSDTEPIVLMEGIEAAYFEFLQQDENGQPAGWTRSWPTPGSLPRAIRLEIEMGEDSQTTWPLLIANVKVDELATTSLGGSRTYSDAIQSLILKSPQDSSR